MGFDRAGFDREVGIRLQLARKRGGLTQGELAERIGITRAAYANVEAGRQRIPVDVVWRAAVSLRVPFSSLVPEPILQPKRAEVQRSVSATGTLTTSDSPVDFWSSQPLSIQSEKEEEETA